MVYLIKTVKKRKTFCKRCGRPVYPEEKALVYSNLDIAKFRRGSRLKEFYFCEPCGIVLITQEITHLGILLEDLVKKEDSLENLKWKVIKVKKKQEKEEG